MFTFQEYLYGWLAYIGFVIVVLAVFWYLTRKLPWFYFRQYLRLCVAIIFLVPIQIPDTTSLWAPAWVVATLELIFGGVEGFMPVAKGISIVVLITLFIFGIITMIKLLMQQQSSKPKLKPKRRRVKPSPSRSAHPT